MSLTLVSSLDEDIGGVPSMQSSYSAGMKRCGKRGVHCECVGRNRGAIVQAIDNYGGRDF